MSLHFLIWQKGNFAHFIYYRAILKMMQPALVKVAMDIIDLPRDIIGSIVIRLCPDDIKAFCATNKAICRFTLGYIQNNREAFIGQKQLNSPEKSRAYARLMTMYYWICPADELCQPSKTKAFYFAAFGEFCIDELAQYCRANVLRTMTASDFGSVRSRDRKAEIMEIAVKHGNVCFLRWFVCHFRPKKTRYAAVIAVKYRQLEVLKWLNMAGRLDHCRARFGYFAAMYDYVEIVEWFLDNFDYYISVILHVAIRHCRLGVIKLLIRRGDVTFNDINPRDFWAISDNGLCGHPAYKWERNVKMAPGRRSGAISWYEHYKWEYENNRPLSHLQ